MGGLSGLNILDYSVIARSATKGRIRLGDGTIRICNKFNSKDINDMHNVT